MVLRPGAWQVIGAQITLGTLVAFQGLFASFLSPINRLVCFSDEIQDLQVYLERLDDIYEYPAVEETVPPSREDEGVDRLSGRVELRDVSFGYSRMEPPLTEWLQPDPGTGGSCGSGRGQRQRQVYCCKTGSRSVQPMGR